VTGLHAYGRAASVSILQTGGSAFLPTVERISWPFLLLSSLGLGLAMRKRQARVSVWLLVTIALQALALLAGVRARHAGSPYERCGKRSMCSRSSGQSPWASGV
jgi:hypothetical protein